MSKQSGVLLKYKWSLLVVVAGIIFSCVIGYKTQQNNTSRIDDVMQQAIDAEVDKTLTRVKLYQYGLRGARGAVLTAGEHDISRALFQRYSLTRDVDIEFPGARGFGFIRRVPQRDVAEFLSKAQKDDWPDFSIRELAPNPAEHFVIQYIEPVERNRAAVGLDIASERNRYQAAYAAMQSGEVRLTGPITLVQATGKPQQSFLILMPLYRGVKTPATLAEREQQAFGWSYAPLIMSEVLANLRFDNTNFMLSLTDVTEAEAPVEFFSSSETAEQGLHLISQLNSIYGRNWQFNLAAKPAFIESLQLRSPLYLVFLGSMASLLLALLVALIEANQNNKRRLFEQQSKLAALVESSADAIISCALDGKISSWNKGADMLFGFGSLEALDNTVQQLLVTPELQDEAALLLQRVGQGESISSFETRRHKKDGSLVDVSITLSPIYDDNAKVIGISKTLRDISAQKLAETKIHQLNENLEQQVLARTAEIASLNLMFKHVLSSATDFSIIATDVDGNIQLFNRGAELLLGYAASEVIGKTTPVTFHAAGEINLSDTAALSSTVPANDFQTLLVLAQNSAKSKEWHYIHKDGHAIDVNLVATPMHNDEKERVGYLFIATDITAERELELGLREAKKSAEEANAVKSMFLANMSHEIRTPMNAVLGMLQLIKSTELSVQQDDYTNKAQIAAKSLLNLINDILDYSKIEAGKLELEQHAFSIEALLHELAVVLSPNLGKKNIELLFDVDTSIPTAIEGDALRLQQVLLNLASNAIKFTAQGEVVVKLSLIRLQPNRCTIRFSVTDTGIGISPAQQKRIFDGFTQAEASTTRQYGGSGLGLVISKNLVYLMGAELQLQSEPGKGSCFWFDLDCAVAHEVDVIKNVAIGPETKVLIVDDNDASREILQKTVQQLGATVFTACSGEDAIKQVEQCIANQQYLDAVLMDYRMPGINGLEAAQQIQAAAGVDKVPVVIMVTAFGRDEIEKMRNKVVSSFVACLTKPVTPQQISQVLASSLSGEHSVLSSRVSPKQSAYPLQGLRLLLVEDNDFNRVVASELLQNEGAQVDIAEGGQEGIDAVLNGAVQYDLVLMDVQMPEVDGLQATRTIRADGRFSTLPIVAMTANVYASDQQDCIKAGMDGHLSKPFDLDKVIETILLFTAKNTSKDSGNDKAIAELAKLNSVGDSALSRVPVEQDVGENNPDNENQPTQTKLTDVVNDDIQFEQKTLAKLLKPLGGNEVFFRRLLAVFENNFVKQITTLSNHVERRERSEVAAMLHTFKGSTGTIGLTTLYQVVCKMETLFMQKQSVSDSEFDKLCEGLTACLNSIAAEELAMVHKLLAAQ